MVILFWDLYLAAEALDFLALAAAALVRLLRGIPLETVGMPLETMGI